MKIIVLMDQFCFSFSSKWNTNEFFQGAYSFRSVNGDKVIGDICGHLCEPIVVPDKDKRNVSLLGANKILKIGIGTDYT